MRSTQLDLGQYDSDKVVNGFLKRYDPFLEHLVDKKVALLEIGVLRGGSLLLWRDYFPLGTIVGIDQKCPQDLKRIDRIHLHEGSQADLPFLSRIANDVAADGFDVIIDDASHIGALTKATFWHLFENHLKPNGLYVIEDWGTGYYNDWCDGKRLNLESYSVSRVRLSQFWLKVAGKLRLKCPMRSHCYGMVGFVKQLIDEQGAGDVTRGKTKGAKATRRSKFDSMVVYPSLVFIKKADHRAMAP